MTNVSANEVAHVNTYYAAMCNRLAIAKTKETSDTNIKKLENMRDMFLDAKLADLFTTSNVDASRFDRAIYASEKVIRFAANAVNHHKALSNQMIYVAFRTVINCYRYNVKVTKALIDAATMNTLVSDDNKHLVFTRKTLCSADTKSAQAQTSLDALVTLNILVANADNTYTANLNNLAIALCTKYEVSYDLEVQDVAQDAANDDTIVVATKSKRKSA